MLVRAVRRGCRLSRGLACLEPGHRENTFESAGTRAINASSAGMQYTSCPTVSTPLRMCMSVERVASADPSRRFRHRTSRAHVRALSRRLALVCVCILAAKRELRCTCDSRKQISWRCTPKGAVGRYLSATASIVDRCTISQQAEPVIPVTGPNRNAPGPIAREILTGASQLSAPGTLCSCLLHSWALPFHRLSLATVAPAWIPSPEHA